MSYASIIKRLPKNLRSTTGLALLASLGAHALLLAIAPVFPSVDSKSVDAKSKPAVELVELTPSEQNRLPPSATLPPFATQLSELPPLPPASSFQLRTSLPLRSTQLDNLRTRRNTRIANTPRKNSLRQSQTKTSKVPKSVPPRNSQSLPLGDFQLDTQQVTTKPQTTYGVNQNYRLRKLESLDSTLDRLSPSEVNEQQLQASNQEDSTLEKNPNSQNTNQSESPQQPTGSTTKETTNPTTNSPNNNRQATNPTTNSPNNNRQAPNSTTNSPNNNRQAPNSTPSDSRLAALLKDNQLRRTQYAYNPANTSTQDAVKNLESWLANVKKDQNIEELKPSKPKTLNLDYPLKACVKQKPNLAGVVALVNPEGKITNVDITQSTGYDTLNTIARNEVKAQSVPKPQNGYGVYQYRVKFNYDGKSCLTVVTPASG